SPRPGAWGSRAGCAISRTATWKRSPAATRRSLPLSSSGCGRARARRASRTSPPSTRRTRGSRASGYVERTGSGTVDTTPRSRARLLRKPARAPGAIDPRRVPALPDAAVVARERAHQIPALLLQVVFEDRAAVAQIGADAEQVVARAPDFLHPEGHALHQAQGAGAPGGKNG